MSLTSGLGACGSSCLHCTHRLCQLPQMVQTAASSCTVCRKLLMHRHCVLNVTQVRMHIHSRSARLGYFPAYHLHYVHGEKYTPSRADIVPARYDALVGAADNLKQPRVCAELHPSPFKSQVRLLSSCGLSIIRVLVHSGSSSKGRHLRNS